MCKNCLDIVKNFGKCYVTKETQAHLLAIVYASAEKAVIILDAVSHVIYNYDSLKEELVELRDLSKKTLDQHFEHKISTDSEIKLGFEVLKISARLKQEKFLLAHLHKDLEKNQQALEALKIVQNLFKKDASSEDNKV